MNETIRLAEEKYRLLIEQSPNAIALFQNEICLMANVRYLKLFKITTKKLKDPAFDHYELIDVNERDKFREKMNRFITSDKPVDTFSLMGVAQDGHQPDIELSVSKIILNGEMAFQLVFNDVSKLRKVERELSRKKSLALIGEMSARIAHEIKNPLASLLAGIQLLESNLKSDAEMSEYFQRLIMEITRVDTIIKGLRTFAREEELNRQAVNLNCLLRHVIEMIKPSVNSSKIKLDFEPNGDTLIVKADEQKLEQVLWNLINNGIQQLTIRGRFQSEFIKRKNMW